MIKKTKHPVKPAWIVVIMLLFSASILTIDCQKKPQYTQYIDIPKVVNSMEQYRDPVMSTIEAAIPILEADKPELADKVKTQAPLILAQLQELKFSLISANNAASAETLPELINRGLSLSQQLNGLYGMIDGAAPIKSEYFLLAQLFLGFVPDKPVNLGAGQFLDPANYKRTDYEAWGANL